jgi:hypothetical protein
VPTTDPKREDYSWTGWFLDDELTDPIPQTGIIVGNDPITIHAGWIDLRNLGVYKASNGDAVIIENPGNNGLVVGTFTASSCGVFRLKGASFLTIVDVNTIRVRAPNSSLITTFTRVTEKKQPVGSIGFGTPLFAEWKQSTTLGGSICIILRDWEEDGSAEFKWDNEDEVNYATIGFSICYVVEEGTLYLLRRYGPAYGRLPGEVIWTIPIENDALKNWAK